MPRNAKPVDLLLLEGRTHLTKEQINQRKVAEIKLTNCNIKADPLVLADERALKEFKFLRKLYKDISFLGTLDSHIVSQYCLAVSELDDLAAALAVIRKRLREDNQNKETLSSFLALDAEIRLKRAELLKLSDRLYLNPVARTKNLPRKEDPPKEDPNRALFGDTG